MNLYAPPIMSLSVRSLFAFALLIGGVWAASLMPDYSPKQKMLMADSFHTNRALSLHQVQQLDNDAWQKVKADSINFGFDTDIFWFRLDIASLNLDSSSNWMLELRYPLLDYVDVYILENSNIITQYATGNSLPVASRAVVVPEFVFPLGDVSKTDWIYIRVQS